MARTLLRLPTVISRTGLSATDIYVAMRAGTFPLNVPIGERSVAWIEEEIDRWIEGRIALRCDKSAKRKKGGPGRGHKGRMISQPQV
jgi:prophage regulatory protein